MSAPFGQNTIAMLLGLHPLPHYSDIEKTSAKCVKLSQRDTAEAEPSGREIVNVPRMRRRSLQAGRDAVNIPAGPGGAMFALAE
jgi:hypothetical protein